MPYRSIKRVIGETSLERKCRLLFLSFLSILIFFAFWWVEHIAEGLVQDATILKGRDFVDSALIRYHWATWEADPGLKQLATELTRDLHTQVYDYKILALQEDTSIAKPATAAEETVQKPATAEEEAILRDLKAKLQEQMRNLPAAAETSNPSFTPRPTKSTSAIDIETVFKYQPVPRIGKILYYQPVYWKNSCFRCHAGFEGVDALGAAEAPMLMENGKYPFRVVKVIIPDHETQDAITKNRALLATIGIITVFLAMIELYVIIRYVVVKPLRHLRDVSDAISRGNTELRADIHTNDEFEELANAFNRMLRHLTDAQAELWGVNQDLDAKVDQLAQLNMRLYEMNRLKSDFLANMSHELRTPLNSIIGFSEVLEGLETLTDKQKRYAHNIRKSGRLLLDLINDILDLAKIEAGKMDVRPSDFHIEAVVHAQCDMVRSLSEEKNIDLVHQAEPDLPEMYQDRNKIQQVLINLLSNAIKFTPEGGRITVGARHCPDNRLLLTVADTGVGIAAEDRDIIFEKFRQSSHTSGDGNLTREYSGTGLGLSIVKELCKLLGGEITFESELGKGSTFLVTLPWTLPLAARRESSLEAQLDELTKSQRLELARGQAAANTDPSPDTPAAPAA
jgi:two-component system sensor histidine kinase BarA